MTDPIAALARWLAEHVEWLRHREFVDEAYRDFAECASRLRHVVDGPLAKRYLGPCGAPVSEVDELIDQYGDDPANGLTMNRCEGDVYGRVGAQQGTCRTCGAQVDQAERRAWLDEEVRARAYRASQIEEAYGIKAKTILSWRDRGQLAAHGYDGHDHRGLPRPTFNVGEVLDLHQQALIRRAENEARRARRQETAA